ncbi:cyclophilin-like domain-containing protein [Schizophyllum fasciatum]
MRPRVFLDIALDHQPIGRVIFELFTDTAPRTSENFRALCTGEKGLSAAGHPLYYKNSPLHRIIKDFMIQGGDIVKGNGTGAPESIYGGPFEDEDLTHPVDTEGLLCMANKGPNTNGSQYFITLKAAPHLDGKHVVVGRVIRGLDVVQQVADVDVDAKFRPVVPVVVSNSGELELRRPPPKPISEASASDAEDSHNRKRKSRRRSPSTGGSDDGEKERKRRHKSKKSKHRKHRSRTPEPPVAPTEPRQETEEEYDARLEREEHERIAARRREELARAKEELRRLQQERQSGHPAPEGQSGIRFKGRGRMKYADPEIVRR